MQTIFTDAKTQDLYSLFKREGQQPSDEVHHRETAAQTLGGLEHLFRIEMARMFLFGVSERLPIIASYPVKTQLPRLNVFTIQLLGKDDPNQEDPEIYIDRWRSYIASYTSVGGNGTFVSTIYRFVPTGDPYEGLDGVQNQPSVPSKVWLPQLYCHNVFLRIHTCRNLAITPDYHIPAVIADNALEMKICVRTYHIFYVPNTADFFYKYSLPSLTGIPRRLKGTWFEKLKVGP